MKITIDTFQGNAAFFLKQAKEIQSIITITKDGKAIAKVIPIDEEELSTEK